MCCAWTHGDAGKRQALQVHYHTTASILDKRRGNCWFIDALGFRCVGHHLELKEVLIEFVA
jgi:hypothetical protein